MNIIAALTRAFLLLAWLASALSASTNHHVILITIDGGAAFYLNDPAAPLPTLRRMAREGAVAEGMRVANPSITWPNHTTLVTGVSPAKHSVLFNGVLVRNGSGLSVEVDPRRDKSDLVAVPTLYDVLHAKGYRTAGINWPCTRNSGTLHDNFPDVPDTLAHTTPRLRDELLQQGWLRGPSNTHFAVLSSAARDQVWTAAATNLIRTRPPNFMMLHMLVTDGIQHRYGPRSPAAYTSLAQVDAQLADVLRALDESGLRQRTTVFVVADHGFELTTNQIHPNVVFRKHGLLDTNAVSSRSRTFKASAQSIAEGGTAIVYLTERERRSELRAQVIQLLQNVEGIVEILGPDRFAELGLPDPEKNPQMGDLLLVAKPGYAFSNVASGEAPITPVTPTSGSLGTHGYLSSNTNMNAFFVAWGRGIRSGARLGVVDSTAVAPTIARLLGQSFSAEGKPVAQLLD
jgi:predicted AlkP superfamily pyrophosphatase or phosphodiesterase